MAECECVFDCSHKVIEFNCRIFFSHIFSLLSHTHTCTFSIVNVFKQINVSSVFFFFFDYVRMRANMFGTNGVWREKNRRIHDIKKRKS